MRTKRFLSLLLAIAMLAAMTISASATQATKVYFVEDFDYQEAAEFSAKFYSAGDAGLDSPAKLVTQIDNMNAKAEENGTDPVNYIYRTSNGGGLGRHELTTNSLGHKAVNFIPEAKGAASQTATWAIFTDEAWSWVDNPDETYIISFELDGKPVVAMKDGAPTSITLTNYGYVFSKSDAAEDGTVTYGSQRPYTYRSITTVDSETGVASVEASVERFHNKLSNAGIGKVHLEEGETVHFALGYEFWNGKGYPMQYIAENGVLNGKTTSGSNFTDTNENIWAFEWGWLHGAQTTMANFKMYTIKNTAGAFNVSTSVTGVVPTSTTNIPVKFSQPVSEFTWDADAVTATVNGEALTYGEDFTVSNLTQFVGNVGGEAYTTANVIFTELEPSSEYVVTFPATTTNEIGTALAEGYNTITFSTPEPDIKIDGFDIVKGWGTASEAAASAFVADGTLQGASIELTNTTESVKNVAVIYAVYASNGQLTDVVYSNGSVAANTTTTVDAGVKLSATGSVKAFVWDGISSLKPHAEATIRDIVAAE